ncbi:hypothetical protein MPL1032_130068 [Mesorhizobium plurifarium]|uniref:Uncharacterized protein n=1 Tax=Mesorhizobium plurifarium TaxID=69974 RepID=A0A0K2VQY9_MESPL|nr:hypothetical protein MPL1032_130068 [Mesorhizobium plurifarium]
MPSEHTPNGTAVASIEHVIGSGSAMQAPASDGGSGTMRNDATSKPTIHPTGSWRRN